ncbi:NAD(P)-binding protein [Glonium stellatum]|uniref:NAD(P)-binding protein n=1 Tax=Glonium stellatum TaxID=574774 RepID=A0A8E2F870_9PEZI|nr:NAD(P)-binding protein [Glonium stellatum]
MNSIQQLFSLEGQTALVTGGTRGIGQAMALALAEAGADILLVQRDTTNQTTKTAIESLGRRAQIYTADLSSPASLSTLVPTILADGHRISILLNCAGIQRRHPAHQFPTDDWDAVLQVNLSATFSLCRDVGAHMLACPPLRSPPSSSSSSDDQTPGQAASQGAHARRGAIINVASLLSFQGGITVPAYAASKGGVAQLTKALSNEWAGRGIAVNAIAPGYIATEMNSALMADPGRAGSILERIPAGRWGEPGDFRGVVVFLAGAASAYVSGEVVTVDGGWMGR